MEKRMKSALIHFYNLFKTSCQTWCQQRHQTFSPLFFSASKWSCFSVDYHTRKGGGVSAHLSACHSEILSNQRSCRPFSLSDAAGVLPKNWEHILCFCLSSSLGPCCLNHLLLDQFSRGMFRNFRDFLHSRGTNALICYFRRSRGRKRV